MTKKRFLVELLKSGDVLSALIFAQDNKCKGINKLIAEYAPNNTDKRKFLGLE